MGRIILVLIAASLLATLIIIRNSSFKPTTSASQTPEAVSKKAEKEHAVKPEQPSRAKTVKKGATNTSQSYNANNPKEASVSTAGSKEEEKEGRDQDGNAFVKSEGTPVYSVNSRQSNIMRLLKRGDRVGTDLEVMDEKGKWTIVRKPDLSRPGFVLDENLQKTNPGKKPQEQ